MPKQQHTHARIIQQPFAIFMQGARLEAYREEERERGKDILLEVQALERSASELFEREGQISERVSGHYFPARLRFSEAQILRKNPFFATLNELPAEDDLRTIRDFLSWHMKETGDKFYMVSMNSPQAGALQLLVKRVTFTRLKGELTPVTFERNWAPAPPMLPGIVPEPKHLHQRFGGDPVTVRVADNPEPRRLFVGGLESQGKQRPEVDAVLNVGEGPSVWIQHGEAHPEDRWANKGEGAQGMSVAEIEQEANWVVERLRAGQKVLVHCVAGMNRSATVCCAVVMQLEGLSAEQALLRVREHHPWSRPDANHWLKLRWLGQKSSRAAE
jgi:hypothetical protein